jgi:hypothetical protein
MSGKNVACAIAKAVFSPDFGGGVALPEIMKEAKLWLRSNVFNPVEILKQMDLRGGTLNYEGLTVLNDVESAAMPCGKKRMFGRLLPTPSCLQQVANILEKHGQKLCPYKMISTPLGKESNLILPKQPVWLLMHSGFKILV